MEQTNPTMQSNRSPGPHWAKLLIPLIVIAVLVVGYGVFAKNNSWWPASPDASQGGPHGVVTASPMPSTSTIVDTTGWQTFRNDKYNYEFKHPADGSADYDVGLGGYVDKASVGFFDATTYFSVAAISEGSTTYSNHPELFALSLEEYVQKLWRLQKDDKNPYNKPLVSDISQITVDGKVAYTFKESGGHVGFGSAGVLEKEMTYVFVRNNGVNFQIVFKSDDMIASKILSTFTFTK